MSENFRGGLTHTVEEEEDEEKDNELTSGSACAPLSPQSLSADVPLTVGRVLHQSNNTRLEMLLAHSKNELMQWRGVRRLSVRPSVRPSVNFCANRFFSQTNGRIATKLAHDGLQVSVHPACAQGQGQGQRSRDTRTFFLILGMSYSVIDGPVLLTTED